MRSDFSNKSVIHFTLNITLVEYQASYIRRSAEYTSAGILCLYIPIDTFEALPGDGEELSTQHPSWPRNE